MAEADVTENYLKTVRPYVAVLHGVLTASGCPNELSLDLLVATPVIANCLVKPKMLKEPAVAHKGERSGEGSAGASDGPRRASD